MFDVAECIGAVVDSEYRDNLSCGLPVCRDFFKVASTTTATLTTWLSVRTLPLYLFVFLLPSNKDFSPILKQKQSQKNEKKTQKYSLVYKRHKSKTSGSNKLKLSSSFTIWSRYDASLDVYVLTWMDRRSIHWTYRLEYRELSVLWLNLLLSSQWIHS